MEYSLVFCTSVCGLSCFSIFIFSAMDGLDLTPVSVGYYAFGLGLFVVGRLSWFEVRNSQKLGLQLGLLNC